MIKGNENLQTIAREYPQILTEFEKHGLGNYFIPEVIAKIGSFTQLTTILNSSGIDSHLFITSLNQIIEAGSASLSIDTNGLSPLHFLAMLPCGLRNPFKEFLEAHIQSQPNYYSGLNYLAEGNVNHEMSFYPKLEQIVSEDELPDIIIASDVNNFFHRSFVERFINKGIFETFMPYSPNRYFNDIGFCDPLNHYTMLTANMLVMVLDKARLGSRSIPSKWSDILSEDFSNDIIMRGEDDFFCNAVLLPFFRDYGMTGIEAMAHNVKSGKHPSVMVKLAGSGRDEAATIYIMPYFFANKIQNKQVEIVWPQDGAIASPVFMMVKKEAKEKHSNLLQFIMSESMGRMLAGRFFPSMHPDVDNKNFPSAVKWLGWDFLTQNDLAQVKNDIRESFMKVWRQRH